MCWTACGPGRLKKCMPKIGPRQLRRQMGRSKMSHDMSGPMWPHVAPVGRQMKQLNRFDKSGHTIRASETVFCNDSTPELFHYVLLWHNLIHLAVPLTCATAVTWPQPKNDSCHWRPLQCEMIPFNGLRRFQKRAKINELQPLVTCKVGQ